MSGNQQNFEHSRFDDRTVAEAFGCSLYEIRKMAGFVLKKKTLDAVCSGLAWEFGPEAVARLGESMKFSEDEMAKKLAILRAADGQKTAALEIAAANAAGAHNAKDGVLSDSTAKKTPVVDLVVVRLMPNPAWVRSAVSAKPVDVFVKNSGFIRAAMARMGANQRPVLLRGCRLTAEATAVLPARYEWIEATR